MFRYLCEKISMSDTDADVYHCEFWFIFCTVHVCFVLFPIDVTAVKGYDVTCLVCNGLCGLLNARRQVTVAYRHTDTTDSPMFSLARISLMFNVRCANRPNSTISILINTGGSVYWNRILYKKINYCRDSAGRLSLRRSRSINITDFAPVESPYTISY